MQDDWFLELKNNSRKTFLIEANVLVVSIFTLPISFDESFTIIHLEATESFYIYKLWNQNAHITDEV